MTASQSPLAALTQSYFVALNHALATGNFSNLPAVIAASATLTEWSKLTLNEPNAQRSTIRGQRAIMQFFRHLSADVGSGRWIVGDMNQVSPATMVVYARIVGSTSAPSPYTSQRLTVRKGKIMSVDLTLYYAQ